MARITCWLQILWCLFILLLFPLNSYSAAWVQEEHHGLIIGNIQDYASCQFWTLQGNLKSGPCFRQFTVNPYFEYGFTQKFTLVLNPFIETFKQSSVFSPFALDNGVISGRYLLWHKDYSAFSTQLGYNQPFRSPNINNVIVTSSGVTPSAQYAIINREHYADFRLLYGTGGKLNTNNSNTWYIDLEAAYRPFFDGAADEIHVDFMVGWKVINQRLVLIVQEFNTFGLHNPSNTIQPNYSLFTIQPSMLFWCGKTVGLEAGVKQDFYGNNIGMGTQPFVALWWKFL